MKVAVQYDGGAAAPQSKTLRDCRELCNSARSWSAPLLRRLGKCFSTISVAAVLLCGCGGTDEGEHEQEQTVNLFQENKGLSLPEEVKQSLGVMLVEVGEANGGTVIPAAAIIEGAQETFVYVESGDYLVRTPVKTGSNLNGTVQITDGLLVGDRVVVNAAKDLWMIELLAVRGGTPCCVVPKKRA